MRSWHRPAAALACASAVVFLAVASLVAEARPGGGQGYSGGSSGGSSSGGSSSGSGSSGSSRSTSSASTRGGGATYTSTEWPPPIWVWLGLGAIGLGTLFAATNVLVVKLEDWNSSRGSDASPPQPPAAADATLRGLDSEFSSVLFEDFAGALFARAHAARNDTPTLDGLSPWLSREARQHLASREPRRAPVRASIIGSMRVVEAYAGVRDVKVEIVFEANLVVAALVGEVTHYVRERWFLERPLGVRTRPWKGVRTFGCPACGAPLKTDASNLCVSCGKPVNDGKLDWMVRTIVVDRLQERPPVLTGTVAEQGTELPTVFSPGFAEHRDALLRDDPALSLEGLEARLRLVFEELQKAWAAQDLSGVRPYISAGLHQHLDYWVTAYRSQGLRNEVAGATLGKSELVRVVRDAHYDSLTYRIRGSGRDFTVVVATGEVVGGSRTEDRRYTEYWTLVRGAGVRGAPRADRRCPGCGAGVKVGMEGNCTYCGILVASGDFDWVLSRIEQDDAYGG